MRWFPLFLLVVAGCGLAAPGRAAAAERSVPCSEVIDVVPFPHVGSSERRYWARQVLGALSVPPIHVPQSEPTGSRPWTHFSKWGLVVRTDAAVTISVPRRWRTRVGIVWGNAGNVYRTLRIGPCGTDGTTGSAYAGGFFLRRASDCVPLVFTVGGRSRTIRFGIVERCR
jgi:hypothetical protein